MSDDDMIRRGDVSTALNINGWSDWRIGDAIRAIAALPAVTPALSTPNQNYVDPVSSATCPIMYLWGMGFIAGKYCPDPTADWEHVWPEHAADVLAFVGKEVMPDDDDSSHARPAASPGVTAGEVEPVAWVIPGGDDADCNGFIPARIMESGEFTKPLYTTPPTALDDPRVRNLVEAARHAHLDLLDMGVDAIDLDAALRDMEGA